MRKLFKKVVSVSMTVAMGISMLMMPPAVEAAEDNLLTMGTDYTFAALFTASGDGQDDAKLYKSGDAYNDVTLSDVLTNIQNDTSVTFYRTATSSSKCLTYMIFDISKLKTIDGISYVAREIKDGKDNTDAKISAWITTEDTIVTTVPSELSNVPDSADSADWAKSYRAGYFYTGNPYSLTEVTSTPYSLPDEEQERYLVLVMDGWQGTKVSNLKIYGTLKEYTGGTYVDSEKRTVTVYPSYGLNYQNGGTKINSGMWKYEGGEGFTFSTKDGHSRGVWLDSTNVFLMGMDLSGVKEFLNNHSRYQVSSIELEYQASGTLTSNNNNTASETSPKSYSAYYTATVPTFTSTNVTNIVVRDQATSLGDFSLTDPSGKIKFALSEDTIQNNDNLTVYFIGNNGGNDAIFGLADGLADTVNDQGYVTGTEPYGVNADGNYRIHTASIVPKLVLHYTTWSTDTDSGYYTASGVKKGIIRFLAKCNETYDENEIASYGVYFVKSDGTVSAKSIVKEGAPSEGGFYADVVNIPETDSNTWYAKAFVTLKDNTTTYSDAYGTTVDWTNNVQTTTSEE
ncbi:MAG: hypothetical protein ACI4CT_07180 [Lachnospiraceae bacterium]